MLALYQSILKSVLAILIAQIIIFLPAFESIVREPIALVSLVFTVIVAEPGSTVGVALRCCAGVAMGIL